MSKVVVALLICCGTVFAHGNNHQKLERSPIWGKDPASVHGVAQFVTKCPPHMSYVAQAAASKQGMDRYKVHLESQKVIAPINRVLQYQIRAN